MLIQHLLLILFWLLFGLLHSILAATGVKNFIQTRMKAWYKYYRIFYSSFAFVSLGFILIYEANIKTTLFWQPSLLQIVFAFIMLFFSIIIMSMFTKKFFFELSGANVFLQTKKQKALLETSFYKYVRHPLYTATLVFIWSIFLLKPQLNNLISCTAVTIYTLIGIGFEEKKLIQNFGDAYINYRNKTPMLLPRFILFKQRI